MPEKEIKNIANSEKFESERLRIIESEKFWSGEVRKMSERLKNLSLNSLKDIPDIQAESISNKQLIFDEIAIYTAKIYRQKQQIKKLEKLRFEFYTSSYPIKTSGPEKLRLIQSDLADRQYIVDIYDGHIEQLRETASEFIRVVFSSKDKIQLSNILGGFEER